ncbi:MAG: TIGR02147 family protein [Bdellovibrionia bacterium]
MNIFEFQDYKEYFNAWVKGLPGGGRGEYRRVSQKLNVSTTMVSQIFNGDKHLTLDLANELAEYLSLNDLETDYFFLLIDYSRAGTFKLRQKLKGRIEKAQKQAQKLEVRLQKDAELSDATKAIFYSSWIYSGIRMLTALPNVNDIDELSERLNLPRPQIQKVLEFLIREKLVIQKDGALEVGPRRTFIGADSPLVAKHHQNWRLHGFQKMVLTDSENLFYSAPMSLSREVAEKIRAELPAFIEKINNLVLPSDSEVVRCLNIDWFEI